MLRDVAVEGGVPREQALAELDRPGRDVEAVDREAGEGERPDDEDAGERPREGRGAEVAGDPPLQRLGHAGAYRVSPMASKIESFGATGTDEAGRAAPSTAAICSHLPSLPPE